MKTPAIVGLALISVAALIGLGHVHPFGNPHAATASGLDSLLKNADMPSGAKAVLVAKCADCHSNETRWPTYAAIAPASWLIERDIVEGRQHMNLSRWAELSPDEQQVLKAEIVSQTKGGDMPPLQYRLIHWDAKLMGEDLQSLAKLNLQTSQPEAAAAGNGDALRGKAVFEKRCTGCHAMDVDREGPRLAGVFGRKAGTVSGFTYSAELKKSGIIWSDANLERWLMDPDAMVTDNKMSFSVAKAQERKDLIAYLKR